MKVERNRNKIKAYHSPRRRGPQTSSPRFRSREGHQRGMSFQIPKLDSFVPPKVAENDKTSHPHLTDFSCLRGINRQKKQLAPLRKRERETEREPLAC